MGGVGSVEVCAYVSCLGSLVVFVLLCFAWWCSGGCWVSYLGFLKCLVLCLDVVLFVVFGICCETRVVLLVDLLFGGCWYLVGGLVLWGGWEFLDFGFCGVGRSDLVVGVVYRGVVLVLFDMGCLVC